MFRLFRTNVKKCEDQRGAAPVGGTRTAADASTTLPLRGASAGLHSERPSGLRSVRAFVEKLFGLKSRRNTCPRAPANMARSCDGAPDQRAWSAQKYMVDPTPGTASIRVADDEQWG
jgi:hypothetical protein